SWPERSRVMAPEVDMADPRRNPPPLLDELRSRRDAILEIARRHGVVDIPYSDPWLAVTRTVTATSTS
ncbi:MAG: hypothetical protein ACRDS9_22990, partial [Pseudonocardiaceae bacterium]